MPMPPDMTTLDLFLMVLVVGFGAFGVMFAGGFGMVLGFQLAERLGERFRFY